MNKKLLIFVCTLIFIVVSGGLYLGYYAVRFLSRETNTSLSYFPKLVHQTINQKTLATPFNLIILGLDPRNDEFEKTQTTDTIMYANLNSDLKLNIVSLPRDLWDYSLNTKINQVYPLAIGQSKPFDYIQNSYQEIVGQKIDRTLIVTTQNLIDLVKISGGVDVYLDKGFTDNKYPNSEYIKNPSPKIPIYVTVSYHQGWNHLNESNITPFVRSRKSAETAAEGGTDLGRIERQQSLLDALIKKFKTPSFYQDYNHIFELYRYFHSEVKTNLTDQDLLSLAIKNYTKVSQFSLNKIAIPSGEDPKTDIIYHPQTFINLQWVFIPQDTKYLSLHQFIQNSINGK